VRSSCSTRKTAGLDKWGPGYGTVPCLTGYTPDSPADRTRPARLSSRGAPGPLSTQLPPHR
jgi:hypothetical protein